MPVLSDPGDNVAAVLSVVTVAARAEFSLHSWTCRADCSGWSEPEVPVDARLVLVRAGRFRRRGRDGPADLDPTVGYFGHPGEEEHFAHPHGGDVCTSVQMSPASWWQLVGEPSRLGRAPLYVDARLDFTHRKLLAAGSDDVDYHLAEGLLGLMGQALRRAADRPMPAADPVTPADRRLVAQARAAIHDEHPAAAGLFPLAELLNTSPYRLSRAFPREVGVSLTRYRNRVRVGRALDRLEAGEAQLASLAAELGFADQAHLSRTVREHVGHTPTALRRALRPHR